MLVSAGPSFGLVSQKKKKKNATTCICTGIIKNNHNYTVQIIHFFDKMFKLYMVLTYIFFKPYIFKYVMVSQIIYIYIYIYMLTWMA